MHYHCEIIMPPTHDVEATVKGVMEPFDENDSDNRNAFWDFWVIGGRWAGAKLKAMYPDEKIDAFHEELTRRNVTVSNFISGKQALNPKEQIPEIDALWREHFPGAGDVCPLFAHSNDQYDNTSLINGDICTLSECPERLTAERVIITYGDLSERDVTWGWANHMVATQIWNGVTHQDTTWKGNVLVAVAEMRASMVRSTDEWKATNTPTDNWLVVTLDYHS